MEGFTALMHAARLGREAMIPVLVDSGALVNRESVNHRTALMEAITAGELQTIARLTACGADLGHTNAVGQTALDVAIASGQDWAVWELKGWSEGVDWESNTAGLVVPS